MGLDLYRDTRPEGMLKLAGVLGALAAAFFCSPWRRVERSDPIRRDSWNLGTENESVKIGIASSFSMFVTFHVLMLFLVSFAWGRCTR